MPDHHHDRHDDSIPESLAQRVIARAIALDSDSASRMPIARLRDIALEAGISAESLERALTETLSGSANVSAVTPRQSGLLRRLGRRLIGAGVDDPEADPWTIAGAIEMVTTNLFAFALFWVPTLLVLSFAHSIGLFRTGASSTASVLVCTIAGIALAWRMRARLTSGILALCAVAMATDVISEAGKLPAQSGFLGSTAFTWLLAGVIGIGVGLFVGRGTARRSQRRREGQPMTHEGVETRSHQQDSPHDGRPFLRLRLQES